MKDAVDGEGLFIFILHRDCQEFPEASSPFEPSGRHAWVRRRWLCVVRRPVDYKICGRCERVLGGSWKTVPLMVGAGHVKRCSDADWLTGSTIACKPATEDGMEKTGRITCFTRIQGTARIQDIG